MKKKKLGMLILAGLAIIALQAGTAGDALAAACPAITVANDKGIAGEFPQQFELAEFEKLANCKMTFSQNPAIGGLNKRIIGNPALPSLAERLPREPLVVAPYDKIGKYGGTLDMISNALEAGTSDLLSVRHVNQAAGQEAIDKYYQEMQEDVRRRNDLINIKHGLDSPLLPNAVGYFKKLFRQMDITLAERSWLAGDTFSLADISLGVYVTRMAGFNMAQLWVDLENLNAWHARFKARPSYAEGVERWGDDTSSKRAKYAADAFPTIKSLWQAAI